MRSTLLRSILLPGLLLPILASGAITIPLTTGWNLRGNGDLAPIDVSARLNDQTKIISVWKWNKAANKWAFYAPSMTSLALSMYAQSKDYDVLTSIASKEGFWVNASSTVVLTDTFSPPPAVSTPLVTLRESDLTPGWNLMGSADGKTPAQLNAGLSSSLMAVGKTINTAWAWDALSARWKFYAPSLAAQGGAAQSDYILNKGYLAFATPIAAADGFWVNIGIVPVTYTPTGTITGTTTTAR